MDLNYKTVNIFPVPVHQFDVNGFSEIQDELIDYVYKMREKDPVGHTISNRRGWQSSCFSLENEDDILQNFLTNCLSEFPPIEKSIKLFVSAWININPPEAFNLKHNHPTSDLSGVLWIKSQKDCGNIIFESKSGLTITLDDSTDGTGAGDLLKSAVYMDGSATTTTYATGGATARGFLELTAAGGGTIKIEDGAQDTIVDNGTTRIGFNSTNEEGKTTSSGLNVTTIEAASSSLARLDSAIETVSKFRANFGAFENRLDAAISNLTTQQINTDAARSRIEDADFAGETSKLTKAQILSQAATSMLAQANASKNSLLALLQG